MGSADYNDFARLLDERVEVMARRQAIATVVAGMLTGSNWVQGAWSDVVAVARAIVNEIEHQEREQ